MGCPTGYPVGCPIATASGMSHGNDYGIYKMTHGISHSHGTSHGTPYAKRAVCHSNGPGDVPWDVKAHGTSTIPWDATTGCSHPTGPTYNMGRPIGSYRTAHGIFVAMGRPMERVTGFSRPMGRPTGIQLILLPCTSPAAGGAVFSTAFHRS